MATHSTGTREQWLTARLALLAAEKELTRRSDELARQRQELPWVKIHKEYQAKLPAPGKASQTFAVANRDNPPSAHIVQAYAFAVPIPFRGQQTERM